MAGHRVNIFWFRRDLRLEDNAGLYHALRAGLPVLPVFIFDKQILDQLDNKEDRRVGFIYRALENLQKKIVDMGSSMLTIYDTPGNAFEMLIQKYEVVSVFTNRDYEPYAIKRDENIKALLKKYGVEFSDFKDQVIFDRNEVVKDNGEPYTVFTPYSKKWKSGLSDFFLNSYPTEKYFKQFVLIEAIPLIPIEEIGFRRAPADFPDASPDEDIIRHYHETRDFPAIKGTTRLGIHLRFGTISIRKLAAVALQLNSTYLNELIWRDFFQMILWNFPRVGKGHSFKPEYENIAWRNNESDFEKWREGKTGYPLVDAGMRELATTGYMHNRLRMVTASFLAKHLLIDWRWGEAWFAEKLLDFDLAANNGGWQWAAGCGCDAAPYFRIFNPTLQAKKFDPDLIYTRHWVPELDSFSYPSPIVDHEFARKRCLEVYGIALGKESPKD